MDVGQISDDTAIWSLQNFSSNLSSSQPGMDNMTPIQGTLTPYGYYNKSATFLAPDLITNNLGIPSFFSLPSTEYVCVNDSVQTSNYACVPIQLSELGIYLSPGSVSLAPVASQVFTASIEAGAGYDPADLLAPFLSRDISWSSWDFQGNGNLITQTNPTFVGSFTQTTATYRAPIIDTEDTLSTSAYVTFPSGGSDTLKATATITVAENLNNQTVSFGTIPAQSATTSLGLTATSSSGLPVLYASATPAVCMVNGATATLSVSGICTIAAEQTGNTTYAAATATQSFTVIPAVQTIAFAAIPSVDMDQSISATQALAATASSGLPVTFSVVSGSGTISGNILTITGVGTVVVAADQAGNADYAAAKEVTHNIVVKQ